MRVRLRPLRLGDQAETFRAVGELEPDGFPFLLDHVPDEPGAGYLGKLERYRHEIALPGDRVPSTFSAATANDQLVGRVSIRHKLNDFLEQFGGHIGYGVRPAFRRRGYAGGCSRRPLIIARAEGVDRVLVTCDDGNLVSAKVIEARGGILDDIRPILTGHQSGATGSSNRCCSSRARRRTRRTAWTAR